MTILKLGEQLSPAEAQMTLALDKALQEELDGIIRTSFPDGVVESVEFESGSIDEDGPRMQIFIILSSSSDPENVADNYFGLTRKVREKLHGQWQDFFPVLTPVFGEGTHA